MQINSWVNWIVCLHQRDRTRSGSVGHGFLDAETIDQVVAFTPEELKIQPLTHVLP